MICKKIQKTCYLHLFSRSSQNAICTLRAAHHFLCSELTHLAPALQSNVPGDKVPEAEGFSSFHCLTPTGHQPLCCLRHRHRALPGILALLMLNSRNSPTVILCMALSH